MPYMFISTQIRLENGPTNVGDEFSDPTVMNYLGARKITMLGNNFSEYHVEDPPRLVLDKLEKIGFRVLTMTGVGQTLVWCLHKETDSVEHYKDAACFKKKHKHLRQMESRSLPLRAQKRWVVALQP